jgi:hypothetical protein
MTRLMSKSGLAAVLRRFARCEEGGGGVMEFCIMLPMFMAIFMAGAEGGIYTTRMILLDRAVDLTMRELGLGQLPNPTHDSIKAEICDNVPSLPNCDANIRVELLPVSTTTWNLPTTDATCIDRDAAVQPALSFNPGAANQLMLVRVCVVQDAMFPGAGIGWQLENGDNQVGYRIISVSAFVNEPI